MALSLGACSNEDLDPKSVFDDSVSMPENDFDRWLKTNYVDEYNIQFKYRFEFNESDAGYNLTPAEYDKAVAMAKLTKYLWLDAYAEVMGNTFIRTYCPKLIHLVGSPQYNTGLLYTYVAATQLDQLRLRHRARDTKKKYRFCT